MPVVAVVASPEHESEGHPERPERVPAAYGALTDVLARRDAATPTWRLLDPGPVHEDAIARCHVPGYADSLAAACARGPGLVDPAPTYVTPGSWAAAQRAAGAVCAVVDSVLDGARWGFALVRPPGHHAEPERPMGFCLLANAAIAARHAQARGVGRVAIVDFDVHHGNGTEAVFREDATVFYASIHQAGIYPGTGAARDRGAGAGLGTTLNVPLPPGAGDEALLAALDEHVLPALRAHDPELVLVSAGYDGHERDPLAWLRYTGAGFHAATTRLAQLAADHAEGRVALVLEGGYDLHGLAEGVAASVRALEGLPDASAEEASAR